MDSLVGTWGLYPWYEEHGTELVHPEDVAQFRSVVPGQALFNCVSVEGIYLVLKYKDANFRVKPSLYKPVAAPKFRFGEMVSLRKGGEYVTGVICDIGWHFKKALPIYYITVGGKKLSKQYWAKDLIPSHTRLV